MKVGLVIKSHSVGLLLVQEGLNMPLGVAREVA